jgi:hypothetical protein
MYCSSCGVAVTQGSSYCNYCGENLSGAKAGTTSKSPDARPESLLGAMVCVFVFGLGAIAILLGMMKAVLHFGDGVILAFALLSFLLMISLEGVFTGLLLRRKRSAGHAGETAALKSQSTRELDAAHARVLPEPLSSVTEHTTRAFDPILRERSESK